MKETGPRHRFLIIEDMEDDVLLLVRHLNIGGFDFDWRQVDTQDSLVEAIREPWDLVFSDYTMPRFSGLKALETVRACDTDIPFIFVSGTISEQAAVEAMSCGAQDFVMKGNTARLLPAVERELKKAEARRQHRRAEEERTRLTAILEATPDLVAILEPHGQLRYLNESGRALFKLSPGSEVTHLDIDAVFTEPTTQRLHGEIFPAASREGVWSGECTLHLIDGRELPVSMVVLRHPNASGETDYLSITARDISERIKFEARLHHKANHDSLTDLPNRYFLTDRFNAELERAGRLGVSVGVLFLDLDNFKRVNDSLGHEAGDSLLQQVSRRLKSCLRPNDTVARLGGDEFTVIAGSLESPENMLNLLRRLREAMERPIIVASQEIYVTFSAGISIFPYDGDDAGVLLRNADTAMYKAKKLGPNQYSFYTSAMNVRSHELLLLEAELKHALRRGELQLYFQPQLNLTRDIFTGAEALMRWNNTARGLIYPGDFIPMLENTGMIIEAGEWALREACRAYSGWKRSGLRTEHVGVNVSAVQFNDRGFLDMVRSTLKDEKVAPRAVQLEITENILMQNPEDSIEMLEELCAMGVSIAIDDFGTGYSSLAYLKSFPLHVLKIDKTFTGDLDRQSRDAAIVETSISLGQKLGYSVLAEGVESESQLGFLRAHGCDLVQGNHLARPLPEQDYIRLIRECQCGGDATDR